MYTSSPVHCTQILLFGIIGKNRRISIKAISFDRNLVMMWNSIRKTFLEFLASNNVISFFPLWNRWAWMKIIWFHLPNYNYDSLLFTRKLIERNKKIGRTKKGPWDKWWKKNDTVENRYSNFAYMGELSDASSKTFIGLK